MEDAPPTSPATDLCQASANTNRAADDAFLDNCITYKLASTRWEREQAFRLLYQAYRRAGLAHVNWHRMRVTPYHLLPTTNVVVAQYTKQIISTITVIEDGRLGLPIESIFPREIAQRRHAGLYMAEASCLADRRSQFRRFFPLFLRVCRYMVQLAKSQGVDQLVIAVHPRHARFYTRHLAFEQISDIRPYPTVKNNPAVALALDLNRVDIERPAHYEWFFGVQLPREALLPAPMSAADRRYFGHFVDENKAFPAFVCRDEMYQSLRAAPPASVAPPEIPPQKEVPR